MSKNEIKLHFNLHETVEILPINKLARVIGIMISPESIEIKCKYYHENSPKYEWFYEDELKATKKTKLVVGFINEVTNEQK